jgi:hypothetical protein
MYTPQRGDTMTTTTAGPAQLAEGRQLLTARLRAMADWLDASPGVPVHPYSAVIISYFGELDEARAARESAPGGWRKETSEVSSWISYEHGEQGDDGDMKYQVTYQFNVSKETTCERVQTGVRHVEAVEAHDEPVFGWKCDTGA